MISNAQALKDTSENLTPGCAPTVTSQARRIHECHGQAVKPESNLAQDILITAGIVELRCAPWKIK